MRVRTMLELVELMQPAAVELFGGDEDAEVAVGPDVVIDNRRATEGCLFVAIPGERVDGHAYAEAAVQAGASGIIGMYSTDAAVPHILAADSVEAMSWLARGVVRHERARGMVSIGVTGSSGKTSTKDLMAQVFEAAGPTVAPVGSQNNEVGVPLTACRVDAHTRFLISEMGARGIGHIAWLTSLVGLDVAVCLNVGRAHVGEFGGVEETARAKSEIVTGLSEKGWAVLNADDPAVAAMAHSTDAQIAWFRRRPPRWWVAAGVGAQRQHERPQPAQLRSGGVGRERRAHRARQSRCDRPASGPQLAGCRCGGVGRRAGHPPDRRRPLCG